MADDKSTATFDELWARLRPEATRNLESLVHGFVTEWSNHHESPIEHLFWLAWQLSGHLTFNRDNDTHYYEIRAQQPVTAGGQQYRVDFVVWCTERFGPGPGMLVTNVAIELDGHEFHERTKEQVTYRNARDRALQADGWKVFHFSGSEVWRAPMGCVAEVEAYCESEMARLYRARGVA